MKISLESTFNCATFAAEIVNFGEEVSNVWSGECGDPLKQQYKTAIFIKIDLLKIEIYRNNSVLYTIRKKN